MVLISTPARSRCVAVVCRLCLWRHSRHILAIHLDLRPRQRRLRRSCPASEERLEGRHAIRVRSRVRRDLCLWVRFSMDAITPTCAKISVSVSLLRFNPQEFAPWSWRRSTACSSIDLFPAIECKQRSTVVDAAIEKSFLEAFAVDVLDLASKPD